MDNFVFKRYGVTIETAILGFKIGGGFYGTRQAFLDCQADLGHENGTAMAGGCVEYPYIGLTGKCCTSKCNGQEPYMSFEGTFHDCQAFWAGKSAGWR